MTIEKILYSIANHRNNKNLSQREVSLRLGRSPQYISLIESNKTKLTLISLLEICEVLEISIFDVIYFEDKYFEERQEIMNGYIKLSKEDRSVMMRLINQLSQLNK